MLAKTLDLLEKTQELVRALKAEVAAKDELIAVQRQLVATKDEIAAEQAKQIEILKKQTGRKISFLFGLVKVRY